MGIFIRCNILRDIFIIFFWYFNEILRWMNILLGEANLI